MELRTLRLSDDRTAFQSGDDALDRFFHVYAGQNQFRHYLGVTYVAVESERVLGFATVAPGQIEIEDLPVATRRKLPRYPLPVLRLARLGVDRSAQAGGIGTQLLQFVCQLAVKMADDYGCAGILVDAKPDAVSFYEKHAFVAFEALEGQSTERPEPTMMFLAMHAIQAASASQR